MSLDRERDRPGEPSSPGGAEDGVLSLPAPPPLAGQIVLELDPVFPQVVEQSRPKGGPMEPLVSRADGPGEPRGPSSDVAEMNNQFMVPPVRPVAMGQCCHSANLR